MQQPPTFFLFTNFLRRHLHTIDDLITSETLLEQDLGVTGDDGVDLLLATEAEYGIKLEPLRETFSMQPTEYLFHGEGIGFDMFGLFSRHKPFVRPFRVGELYEAVCRKISEQGQ